MNRGTAVYFLMFVALGVGLWAVLHAGARLDAPADLSGYWEVRGADDDGIDPVGKWIQLEQSGKYFRVRFEAGRRMDMKLVEQTRQNTADGRTVVSRLVGKRWTITIDANLDQETARVDLQGRATAEFRVRRTFDGAGKPVPDKRPPGKPVDDEVAATDAPVAAAADNELSPYDALQR